MMDDLSSLQKEWKDLRLQELEIQRKKTVIRKKLNDFVKLYDEAAEINQKIFDEAAQKRKVLDEIAIKLNEEKREEIAKSVKEGRAYWTLCRAISPDPKAVLIVKIHARQEDYWNHYTDVECQTINRNGKVLKIIHKIGLSRLASRILSFERDFERKADDHEYNHLAT